MDQCRRKRGKPNIEILGVLFKKLTLDGEVKQIDFFAKIGQSVKLFLGNNEPWRDLSNTKCVEVGRTVLQSRKRPSSHRNRKQRHGPSRHSVRRSASFLCFGKQFHQNRTERNDEDQASKISQDEPSTEEPNTTNVQKIDKDAANGYRSDCDFRSIEPRSAGSNEQDPPNIARQQKPATE